MKGKSLILLVTLAITHLTFSQKHWEHLFNNDRSAAVDEVRRQYTDNSTIEHFLSRQIIFSEYGMLANDPEFMKQFLNYEDAQYYLYALWSKPYVFTDYFKSGFDTQLAKKIDLANQKLVDQPTVRDALIYLKAISRRHFNDFDSYRKLNEQIPSIRQWQHCGVFENFNSGGIDRIYAPETTAVSAQPFEANSNGRVNWYTPEYPTYEAYSTFRYSREYGSGVSYAQSFFTNSTEREAVIRVGCSSKFKIWLNDALVYENLQPYRTDIDAYNIKVKLPKGNNRILIKLADQSSYPYFIVRITDLEGNMFNDITYTSSAMTYEKSTYDQLQPELIPTANEAYFIKKIEEYPDNFFYNYCLFSTYMRNGKYLEAKNSIEKWYEQYPNSSTLRYMMIQAYAAEGEDLKFEEIKENLILEDPDYHISMSYKFQDIEELLRLSVSDMTTFLRKYAAIWDDELVTAATEFVISLRQEDRAKIKFYLDQLTKKAMERGSVEQLRAYIPLYNSILNDKAKYKQLLEATTKKYFDYSLYRSLAYLYSNEGKYSRVTTMLKNNVNRMDCETDPLFEIIDYLHYMQEFNQSMPYIDKIFTFYPYSFRAMELKGDVYLQTGRTDLALEWYAKSLKHNSENLDLRKKVQDISGQKDIIEEYKMQDVYKFIRENRNKITTNNYGYNILLDESVVELYEDAGGKARYTLAIEITSEQGADYFKEYDLGLYGNYNIIKSEVVKKNGSVSPGDAAGSSFVFTNLEPQDVIYIDYQISFTGYGRFFRDFDDNINLAGDSPIRKTNYTLIVPKEKEIFYKTVNRDVPATITKNGDNTVYQWGLENFPGNPKREDFMPANMDVCAYLHLSTIPDWAEITNWYSDLVRPQLVESKEVEKDFSTIFPDGTGNLTDDQKAEKIYYYIMNNFNYSSVSFRQSGYVPQKPSTTISTKLGDCKDFSALFVVLAKKAGLEANMVLCLTSDYGTNAMILPNQDFNHCIVKVMLNGEEQFLELTNKYLPYKAIPSDLLESTILEIPYAATSKPVSLRKLTNPKRIQNENKFEVVVHLKSSSQNYTVKSIITGASRSGLAYELENPNMEVVKTEMADRFQRTMEAKITVDSVYAIQNVTEKEQLLFTTDMVMNEKLNKIGNFKIWKMPSIMNAYTDGIISLDSRAYPIAYTQYENSDRYETDYTVFLEEEGEFTEIPQNKTLTYKNHSYSIVYKKVGPKELRIKTIATVSLDDISVEEYPEYKAYVKKVLEANEELVGFK